MIATRLWITPLLFAALTLPILALAAPFLPTDEAQVLERLPFKPGDPAVRQQREQRAALLRNPRDAETAVQAATQNLHRGRELGDPRYFGYAQAALTPWWNDASPPPEILLLRATLRQSSHDFTGALADLDLLLKTHPENLNAWLTRAIIYQVKGDFENARKNCAPLAAAKSGSTKLLGLSCIASVNSFNGQAQQSYDAMQRALQTIPDAAPADQQWPLTIMADIAARLDQPALAEQHFKEALALGRDNWTLGTYADFLLDQNRPQEVMALLKDETAVDTLLLLLTLAEQAVKAPPLSKHVTILSERFAASRMRNDQRHRREEARFALHLLHQPKEALRLAQDNWAVQHEPEDARILLAAALAAEDRKATVPVVDFLTRVKLEDPGLAKLVEQARAMPL